MKQFSPFASSHVECILSIGELSKFSFSALLTRGNDVIDSNNIVMIAIVFWNDFFIKVSVAPDVVIENPNIDYLIQGVVYDNRI